MIRAMVAKRGMKGLEILSFDGEGYRRLIETPKWTVAALNFTEKFARGRISYLERHLATDESFVLLDGEGELIIGEQGVHFPLEPLKVYNVKQGVWHNIILSTDARLLLVEDSNTSKDNTEYQDFTEGK